MAENKQTNKIENPSHSHDSFYRPLIWPLLILIKYQQKWQRQGQKLSYITHLQPGVEQRRYFCLKFKMHQQTPLAFSQGVLVSRSCILLKGVWEREGALIDSFTLSAFVVFFSVFCLLTTVNIIRYIRHVSLDLFSPDIPFNMRRSESLQRQTSSCWFPDLISQII